MKRLTPALAILAAWASLPAPDAHAAPEFLPDSAVLARVGTTPIRVDEFVKTYYMGKPSERPPADSSGRVTHLRSLINREVLKRLAREVNKPLNTEDRAALREFEDRTLSNTLYRRAVLDSVVVPESEVQRLYAQHKWELKLNRITLVDEAVARKVRADLMAKRVTWRDALKAHAANYDPKNPDGELGWRTRTQVGRFALDFFGLPPGSYSGILRDGSYFHIVQVVARRPAANVPSLNFVRRFLEADVRRPQLERLTNRIHGDILSTLDVTYEMANIEWASGHFASVLTVDSKGQMPSIEINAAVPHFSEEDQARVLARSKEGVVTLGRFAEDYEATEPMFRPSVNLPEALKQQVDVLILSPHFVRIARERGLDKDPLTVAQVERRREELMIEHLYGDSVESKVITTPEKRRRYYDRNKSRFVTYARVRYAGLFAQTRAAADSIHALLSAGAKAEDLIAADSLAGRNHGHIRELSENHQDPLKQLLFEEMKPGDIRVHGPYRDGTFAVVQLYTFDAGRQLSFDEVQAVVDESVRNTEAEALLNALIARHAKRFHVEQHPELVMRVALRDPSIE